MSERIHDDEPDEWTRRQALLEAECKQWARSPIEYLETSGTDNAMWRIRIDDGTDTVIRLPRRPGAAAGVLREALALLFELMVDLLSPQQHAHAVEIMQDNLARHSD